MSISFFYSSAQLLIKHLLVRFFKLFKFRIFNVVFRSFWFESHFTWVSKINVKDYRSSSFFIWRRWLESTLWHCFHVTRRYRISVSIMFVQKGRSKFGICLWLSKWLYRCFWNIWRLTIFWSLRIVRWLWYVEFSSISFTLLYYFWYSNY